MLLIIFYLFFTIFTEKKHFLFLCDLIFIFPNEVPTIMITFAKVLPFIYVFYFIYLRMCSKKKEPEPK